MGCQLSPSFGGVLCKLTAMLDRAHLFLTPIFAIALITAATAATAACTKSEGTSSGTTTAASGSAAMPTPKDTAATAEPDASPTAADTTTGTAPTGGADATAAVASGALPTASAGTKASAVAAASAAPATSGSAAAAECGTKPQPDCPLQAWMKANTNPAIAANDLPSLATALDKTVAFAPAGYTNWVSISKDGAKAARAGDMTAAKASCRGCHDLYKQKYKTEMRARKI